MRRSAKGRFLPVGFHARRSTRRARRGIGLGWIKDPTKAAAYKGIMRSTVGPLMRPKMKNVWKSWRRRTGGSFTPMRTHIRHARVGFPMLHAPRRMNFGLGADIGSWLPTFDVFGLVSVAGGFVAPKMILNQPFIPDMLKTGIPKYGSMLGIGLVGNIVFSFFKRRDLGQRFFEGTVGATVFEVIKDNVPAAGLSEGPKNSMGVYVDAGRGHGMNMGEYVSRPTTGGVVVSMSDDSDADGAE